SSRRSGCSGCRPGGLPCTRARAAEASRLSGAGSSSPRRSRPSPGAAAAPSRAAAPETAAPPWRSRSAHLAAASSSRPPPLASGTPAPYCGRPARSRRSLAGTAPRPRAAGPLGSFAWTTVLPPSAPPPGSSPRRETTAAQGLRLSSVASPTGWPDSAGMAGRNHRNQWPACSGIGGRNRPEWVAGLDRNRWPASTGIRKELGERYGLDIVWRGGPYSYTYDWGGGHARDAAEWEIEEFTPILIDELSLYPEDFLTRVGITRVLLARDLWLTQQGVEQNISGYIFDDALLLSVSYTYKVNNRDKQRRYIHHLVWHQFDGLHGTTWEDPEWVALNPEGFEYGS